MSEQPMITGDHQRIQELLRDLSKADSHIRAMARRELAQAGPVAITELIKLLTSVSSDLRWEVANTLSTIGDPAATDALIAALDDDRGDIRWLAAQGLIAIGEPMLVPLLRALISRSDSFTLREGAHHVLVARRTHDSKDAIGPVLRALEGPTPSLETPLAAYHALDHFR